MTADQVAVVEPGLLLQISTRPGQLFVAAQHEVQILAGRRGEIHIDQCPQRFQGGTRPPQDVGPGALLHIEHTIE